jgi:hypothetical protein
MKLEVKHLAGYLPYELILVARNVLSETPRRIYSNLNAMNIMSLVEGDTLYKPILRPLSDLTKEIEVNGEKFVPLYVLQRLDKAFIADFIEVFGIEECKFSVIEKLHEWHFDIYGLIESDLAIDINTL